MQRLTCHFIEILSGKLRQKIGFLYRNRASFPIISRKRVVEAVFLSVLDYGDTIYRHAATSTLKSLDSVYHSAIRFVTGDIYGTHHCILYNHVGWSSLTERRELHWHLYLYKAILGDCPKYISVFLEWAPAGPYLTRSSGFPTFKVPTVNSDFGRTAFSFCGPTTWNNLQETLKLTTLIPLNRFRSLVTKPNEICHCF